MGANTALALGPWFVQLADTGPLATAFWRVALATPLLVPIVLLSPKGRRLPPSGSRVRLAMAGLVFALSLGIYFAGIVRTTLTNAVLLGNSAVLFFPLYDMVIARVGPSRPQTAALLLATLGGALLLGRSFDLDPRQLAGDALCLVAGILYTAFFVVTARLGKPMAALPMLVWITAASVVPLLGLAIATGQSLTTREWGPLFSSAIVAQIVGQGLLVLSIARLSPVAVGAGLLIQPIIGATIDLLAYGRVPAPADAIGAALVAAAVVLATASPDRSEAFGSRPMKAPWR